MDHRKRLGHQGEKIALAYLADKGYQPLDSNWRCATGELDIVMKKDKTYVFVEVRTRRGDRFGSPEESITPTKQTRLIELAQTYLQQQVEEPYPAWRIDIVTVRLNVGPPQINHIENAIGW